MMNNRKLTVLYNIAIFEVNEFVTMFKSTFVKNRNTFVRREGILCYIMYVFRFHHRMQVLGIENGEKGWSSTI